MQRGKYKCKQLKAVRKRIAEENGIPLEQKECTYAGPCRGTCPHCEAEVRYLERALTDRIRLGRVATVAGLSLGLAACGGQNGTTDTMLTTDSSLAADTLPVADTASPYEDTVYPEVTTTGLIIYPPDDLEVPPPPPPETPEGTGELEGIVSPPLEEGEIDDEIEGEAPFVIVETEPSFPGGIDSLYAWIGQNLRYPQQAQDNKIEGKVYVTFVVEKDGSIANPKLLRDIGFGCGAEAIRVVKAMPKWNPGKQRGKPVRVQFNLPITFSLK